MIQIQSSWLLGACLLLAILSVGSVLWSRRQALTVPTAIQAVKDVGSLFSRMYGDAVIVVQWVEQISKPDAPGQPEKLTNEQKKAQAVEVMQRWWKDADADDIEVAVEAAVNGVKMLRRLGVNLPQFQLTGEEDISDVLSDLRLQGIVPPASPPQPGTGSI